MLAEEQHRDQVAADHEEHLDPEEAARSQLGLPWYTITAITASAQAIQAREVRDRLGVRRGAPGSGR